MADSRIKLLLQLMERAFSGNEHALLDNLASVELGSWDRVPDGGSRSVREITYHVGLFKYMYANHGFRAGDLDYSDPPATPPPHRLETVDAAVHWLREAHTYLTECIGELDDDSELEVSRKAHWGEAVPTYHLVVTMLEHDLYHAGEINRTRALLQDDDDWFVPDPPECGVESD